MVREKRDRKEEVHVCTAIVQRHDHMIAHD